MKLIKIFTYVLSSLLFTVLSCKDNTDKHRTDNSVLIKQFKYNASSYPKISVHRGGKGLENYPENSLETLQYINDSIYAVFEIDVAQTSDGHLVLMHDNSIDRTTTGTGLISELSYSQLLEVNLVDDFGNETAYKIPLFSKILEWCKANNVILTVDIKRSVSQETVINAIREANAEDVCIIITYDVEQAKSAYKLAPDLLLSVSARNDKEFNRLIEAKIPMANMLAFTGTRLSPPELYQRLHKYNIVCMLGTLGNLDKQASAKSDSLYLAWMRIGVDMIATDRPFEAYKAIDN